MLQAQFQAIGQEIKQIKQELREFIIIMSTTDLEKQNLEAHVDLCSERYKGLHDRLSAIELRLQKMNEDMGVSHKSQTKTIIATAGTVVAGLLSTVVVILMKMPG
jgi:pantothenate kinase|tara:strand:- start:715 stop:1029 length:315 start_codon:yes stop_codon:yes gene_type:complete